MTYSICCCQVDTKTTSSGTEEEDKDIRPGLEVGHHVTSFRDLGGTIQSLVGVLPVPHVLLEDKESTQMS